MNQSSELLQRALARIPGGVNSPVRAFHGVGGDPVFFEHAEGAYLYDVSGQRYVDYVGSWGPMIHGHAQPQIVQAVQAAAAKGLSFGAPAPGEVSMAERLCELVPGMDMVRMVNSGTEATMSALRLARAATGRERILKFEGCYHGHADSFLVKAGSGAATLGQPNSPGVPAELAALTLNVPYNDLDAVAGVFAEWGEELAAVIVEPVAGNMNCVLPVEGFLPGLRDLCDRHGAVLIFDEVMTGFRVARGGACERFGVRPDLITLGKVIGGGMPVGAFGGRRELMQQIAPAGPVYQAGTLSGNPVAMAAGLANLELLAVGDFYPRLEAKAAALMNGFAGAARAAGVPLATTVCGGMFGFFFTDLERVDNFQQAGECDMQRFRRFFHAMLDRGVYLAPSAFEAGFISQAHDEDTLEQTLTAARAAFVEVA